MKLLNSPLLFRYGLVQWFLLKLHVTAGADSTATLQDLVFNETMLSRPLSPNKRLLDAPTMRNLQHSFSIVGDGMCLDKEGRSYTLASTTFEDLSGYFNPDYCLTWCSQNLHVDLVGVEAEDYSPNYSSNCKCLFSANITVVEPMIYDPTPLLKTQQSGRGEIVRSSETVKGATCWRNDNYEDQTTLVKDNPKEVPSKPRSEKVTSNLSRQLLFSEVGDGSFSNAINGSFSEVGDGYCLDSSRRYYSSIVSWSDPAYTIRCDYWCSQNPHPNLVGMEIYNYECSCLFSGGIPNGIHWSSYNPTGSQSKIGSGAVGPVVSTMSFGDGRFCYRYTMSTSTPTNKPTRTPTQFPTPFPNCVPHGSNPLLGRTYNITYANASWEFFVDFRVGGTWRQRNVDTGAEYTIGVYQGFSGNMYNYTGGDWCYSVGKNRTGTVQLTEGCNMGSPRAVFAAETSTCVYSIIIEGVCYCTNKPTSSPTKKPTSTPTKFPTPFPYCVQRGSNPLLGRTYNITYNNGMFEFILNLWDGGTWRQRDGQYDILVGVYQNFSGNIYNFAGGDWCDAAGKNRSGIVELTEGCNMGSPRAVMADEPNTCTYYMKIDGLCYCPNSPSAIPLTPSPTNSPTKKPCYQKARKVKLQSLTGASIHVFEVEVYSSGDNIIGSKLGKSQSSTLNKFGASNAFDGNLGTFSHTAMNDKVPWLEVDLGGLFPIESVKIFNRWCKSQSDPNDCLDRLSHAALLLFNNEGKWVSTTLLGPMSGVPVFEHKFSGSPEYCTGV